MGFYYSDEGGVFYPDIKNLVKGMPRETIQESKSCDKVLQLTRLRKITLYNVRPFATEWTSVLYLEELYLQQVGQ